MDTPKIRRARIEIPHVPVRERRAKEHRQELVDLIDRIGGEGFALDVLNVHRTTLMRWIAGTSRIPDTALVALRAGADGQLPYQQRGEWKDWRFDRFGNLWAPNGQRYTPGMLLALPYERAVARSIEQERDALKAELDRVYKELAQYDHASNDRRA